MIGAGPAGLSAAVQLKKEKIEFQIFEKGRPGGLLRYANRVDNLLGHLGTAGRDLSEEMVSHALSMGIGIRNEEVVDLEMIEDGFKITTKGGEVLSDRVILATGSTPIRSDLVGIQYELEDPEDLAGERLLIIGGGDLALDNALRAHGSSVDVTILHRSEIKANNGLKEEVAAEGIRSVEGNVSDIELVDGSYVLKGEGRFEHLAAFIGRSPDRSLIEGMKDVSVNHPSHSTSIKGLYLIGDAASVESSQAAYAMSSGLSAAMDIGRRLKADGNGPCERS